MGAVDIHSLTTWYPYTLTIEGTNDDCKDRCQSTLVYVCVSLKRTNNGCLIPLLFTPQAQVQPNQPHPMLFLSTKNITTAHSHRRPVRVGVTLHVTRWFLCSCRCLVFTLFLVLKLGAHPLLLLGRVGSKVEVEVEQLYAYREEACASVICFLFCRRAPCNDK